MRNQLAHYLEMLTDRTMVTYLAMRGLRLTSLDGPFARGLQKKIGQAEFRGASRLADESEHKAREMLHRDGIASLGQLLSDEEVAFLHQFADNHLCFDPWNSESGRFAPADAPDSCHVPTYDMHELAELDLLFKLANDPIILRIAQSHLGARPTLSAMDMWWSLPGRNQAQEAQNFHRDIDDFRFCKLFVYLTPVGPGNGPHVYVKGSRFRNSPLRNHRRYSDKEVADAYGNSVIETVYGKPGDAFLEDTFGLHKGTLPNIGSRLILQFEYSLRPLTLKDYKPSPRAVFPYSDYVNRLYVTQA